MYDTSDCLQFKAATPVVCYLLLAEDMIALLSHSAFNYALIKEFKLNQKLFRNLAAFITHVSNAFASGSIVFEEILAKYRRVSLSPSRFLPLLICSDSKHRAALEEGLGGARRRGLDVRRASAA